MATTEDGILVHPGLEEHRAVHRRVFARIQDAG